MDVIDKVSDKMAPRGRWSWSNVDFNTLDPNNTRALDELITNRPRFDEIIDFYNRVKQVKDPALKQALMRIVNDRSQKAESKASPMVRKLIWG